MSAGPSLLASSIDALASGHDLSLEVCSNCHPFYTGKQKIVDTAGRVDKFRKKYANIAGATKSV